VKNFFTGGRFASNALLALKSGKYRLKKIMLQASGKKFFFLYKIFNHDELHGK